MSSFDRSDTAAKLCSILTKELKVDAASLKEEKTFKELGADSLDMFEITLKVEEAFGLEIPDNDAEQLQTIKATVDYLQSKRTK
ncbi:acyl carrier protein [Candidatus Babeliales bacterium]|nr:acyl carrier protein [Candidatus Babeliales bacterium]